MRVILLAAAALALCTAAQAETLRDGNGRIIGTRDVMPSGTVVMRNARGEIVSTESTSPSGTITRRNGNGAIVGSASDGISGRTTMRDANGRAGIGDWWAVVGVQGDIVLDHRTPNTC